jgi:tRNA G18 (ribose-2'-O)-methylase SpoU
MKRVESLDDPRIAPYRNLRDRTLRGESIFLSEGILLTERLLASRFEVESVFCSEEYADRLGRLAKGKAPVYVASSEMMRLVVGFDFHRGVLAVGRRQEDTAPEDLLGQLPEDRAIRLVVCVDVTQPENLGLVMRSAAGLGVDGVILSERCCDPLSRRILRLSMGCVFRVPYARAKNLAAELPMLGNDFGVQWIATTLDATAAPLPDFRWPRRAGLLVGHEFEGIAETFLRLCDFRVTIPMRPDVDSLNLGVAAGIFIYQMMLDKPA